MSRRATWMIDDAPDQTGRVAVITGGSGGLGRETARRLASRGAMVILACRDVTKGEDAADAIAAESTQAVRPRIVRLDLSSVASVRAAAEEICATCPRVDLLINNAGVMTIPFGRSADGFELTFATNHLGHFALTGLLLERLLAAPGSRVVTVGSSAHRRANNGDLVDLETPQNYEPGKAYDRSKLANLLFAYELQHRLRAADADTISLAAHPGNARTELWRTSSPVERALIGPRLSLLTFWLAQDAERGALPIVRAALDPTAQGGDYYGPSGWFQYTGPPTRVDSSPSSYDRSAQRALWQASEQMTGVSYSLADADGG